MIDVHSHLLPGIDDGPRSTDEAMALAQACVDDGITHCVLTPHVYPGVFDNGIESIRAAFVSFQTALEAQQIELSVSFAAEVRLSPEVFELIEAHRIPMLVAEDGIRTMLLELPDGQIPVGARTFVAWLLRRGIRPLIVHPERNKAVMEHPEKLLDFVRDGCMLQLTAGSLVGQFGARARVTALHLLEKGWVTLVASDAHNLRGRRPMMSAARAALVEGWGTEFADVLTRQAPAALCGVSSALKAPLQPAASAGSNASVLRTSPLPIR